MKKIKPRNPLVAPSLFRKAGQHRKSFKALRRDEKVKVQQAFEGSSRKSRRQDAGLTSFSEGSQASVRDCTVRNSAFLIWGMPSHQRRLFKPLQGS